MTNHYYTQNPDVLHEEQHWPFTLLGNELLFTTDNGVFSKNRVDYGSRVLLAAFNAAKTPAGPWLDLGTGYGPIGLALAKRWPDRQVTMVDVNELALELARKNATANQIENVEIKTSDIYDQVTQRYAAILTNPPVRAGKQVVTAMLNRGCRSSATRWDFDGGLAEEARGAIGGKDHASYFWQLYHYQKRQGLLHLGKYEGRVSLERRIPECGNKLIRRSSVTTWKKHSLKLSRPQ